MESIKKASDSESEIVPGTMKLERIRKASNTLEKEIALGRMRFIGNLFLILSLLAVIVFLALREDVIAINPLGETYSAKRESRNNPQILKIEAEDHVGKLYEYFFSFNHLNYNSQDRLEKAFALGGNAIKNVHKAFRERAFYNEVVRNNYVVESILNPDSSVFEVHDKSIMVKAIGTMVLRNNEVIETRKLNMTLEILLIPRVYGYNVHGMSIERLRLDSNEVINSESAL